MMPWQDAVVQEVLTGYIEIIKAGLPIAFIIGASNLAINMIFNAFFGGRLSIGGKSHD